MEINGIPSSRLLMLIMVACYATSKDINSDDIRCLQSIMESLEDPLGHAFSSWEFNDDDMSEGFICRFVGVICRHDKEEVISIQLPGMGLKGQFPNGITNCITMETLDLSGNHISGPIAWDICARGGYLVLVDLSSNSLSGQIPPGFANCSYINSLKLDNNQLTGEIPQELNILGRIKVFNVSNNRLSGPVPTFDSRDFSAESYANNSGLCGGPLKACKYDEHDDDGDLFFSGFAVGCTLFTILSMLFMVFYFPY